MRVAISQPEHFPYLGFFQKMACVDLFILLDHVKFQGPGSFQVRNWFYNGAKEKEWFGVPVQGGSKQLPIDQVRLAADTGWRAKLKRKLEQRFPEHAIWPLYQDEENLAALNIASILYCRERLQLTHIPLLRSSQLSSRGTKSALVAQLCHEVGATHYVCGPGARSYLDERCFKDLTLELFEPHVPDYQSALAHIKP